MKILYRRYRCHRALVYIPDNMPWWLFAGLNNKLDAVADWEAFWDSQKDDHEK